jgi:amino acid transporter
LYALHPEGFSHVNLLASTTDSATDPAAAAAALMAGGAGLTFLLIGLVSIIFSIILYWRVAVKAGYNGALSLLLFVPLVNLIVIVMFAFSTWPIERELQTYRTQGGPPGGYGVVPR